MRTFSLKVRNNELIYMIYTFSICLYTSTRILTSSYLENFLYLPMNFLTSLVNYFCCGILILLFFTQKTISIRKFFLAIVITVVVGVISIKIFDMPLFVTYLFILSFPNGISLTELAKALFKSYVIVIFIVIIALNLGIVQDYTLFQHNILRHSFGFVSPNAFANVITLGIMFWIYYKSKNWKIIYALIGVVTLSFVYYYTNSRLAFYIGITDILITTIIYLLKKKTFFQKIKNDIFLVGKYIAIILSIICIGSTVYFSSKTNKIFETANEIFTGRLSWMVSYYNIYGIHLIGQPIITVSRKESIETGEQWKNIDNAYALFAIKYGMIFLIGFLVLYYLLGNHLKKIDNYDGAIYVILICIIGLTENFLIMTGYNFSLLMIAEMISMNKKKINLLESKGSQQNEKE